MADILISTVGFFWRADYAFWGAGRSAGSLFGVPAQKVTATPIDFREQSGIYVLYADYQVVYVGQSGLENQKLLKRLKQHRVDDLADRWDRFSWFGIRRVLSKVVYPLKRVLFTHPSPTCSITWREF